MSKQLILKTFLDAAEAWICDGYSLDFRYIAIHAGNGYELWDASLTLNPLPSTKDLNFQIDVGSFSIGQIQRLEANKSYLLELLKDAINGRVGLIDAPITLSSSEPLDCYSEMSHRDRWFSDLHVSINSRNRPAPTTTELAVIDSALRLADPPFDGLNDVANWLGLKAPGSTSSPPKIEIRVGPPVDLIFDGCSVAGDTLKLTLHAHPGLDTSLVRLSFRAVPGNALAARQHATNNLVWGDVYDGRREGTAQVNLENADSVLVMLMVGTSTVRRQWFVDPEKARNYRLLATQHFDRDLKMLKHAVLDSHDSVKFEQGIASLLFLLGFNPAIQIETDAPDLIVTTPGGRLAIVECTTRVADFASKIGKLVDRRGALSKSLEASAHRFDISSVLVCRLPRDQIATHADELRVRNTILITGEDIAAAFDRLRSPNDPDSMLADAIVRTTSSSALIINQSS